MSFFIKLKGLTKEFTAAEKKIGSYIMENGKEVLNFSTQELAKETDTSPASVVRFSRKLGYDGFGELKIELAKSLTKAEDEGDIIDDIIDSSDTTVELIKKVQCKYDMCVNDTISLIDETKIKEAVEKLQKARNIYLFAIGASGLVALDFQYKLLRINKTCIFSLDSNIQMVTAVHLKENDVAVCISYSGKTKEVNLAAERVKKNGATCIAVTKYGNNPLSQIADINLFIPDVEKDLRFGAISSRLAQLLIMDILFLGIAKDNLEDVEKYIIETRKIIKPLKQK